MLELPEILTLIKQLNQKVKGRMVCRVLPPVKPHKFCWFTGDPAEYDAALRGHTVCGAEGLGMFADILFTGDLRLTLCDGVHVRLVPADQAPKNYQLLIELDDGTALVFTVAMYGGVHLHGKDFNNPYYKKSRKALSPFSPEFPSHFMEKLIGSKGTLSAKAFLATEQRFPGIGNGVLQDILFEARVHPKRKLASLHPEEKEALLNAVISTLRRMAEQGGRDTERDLFENPGGYVTKMSKNTWKSGCPVCGGPITKEAYLGGSVYYCPCCQKL